MNPFPIMRRADDAELQRADEARQVGESFAGIFTDELRMERYPHRADRLVFGQLPQTAQTVQRTIQADVDCSMGVGMFVQTPQDVVLALLVELDLFSDAEVYTSPEILLHQEQRFVRVRR